MRRLDEAGGERISCGVAARADDATGPADLLRAADEAQYRAKRRADDADVLVAGDALEEPAEPHGRDRAYRAGDPQAMLARELLELMDELNGASAADRLARLRERLERAAEARDAITRSGECGPAGSRLRFQSVTARKVIGVLASGLALAASCGKRPVREKRLGPALRAGRGDRPVRARRGRRRAPRRPRTTPAWASSSRSGCGARRS